MNHNFDEEYMHIDEIVSISPRREITSFSSYSDRNLVQRFIKFKDIQRSVSSAKVLKPIPLYTSCFRTQSCKQPKRKKLKKIIHHHPILDRNHSSSTGHRNLVQFSPMYHGNSKRPLTSYKILVTTSDEYNAGTNASVFLTLKGDWSNSIRQRLYQKRNTGSSFSNNFEFKSGTTNSFDFVCSDLGNINSIIIEHNGIREEDSWLLDSIQVIHPGSKLRWMFLCGHWLSLYKEDGQIIRELFGVKNVRTLYEIVTVTGDMENAETDSRVFITLYGRTGITPRIELTSKIGESPFRRGRSSKFIVKAPLVGPLIKLKIIQDGSGSMPDWFLERIVVTDLSHPKWTFYFPCQNWISARYTNSQLMKVLYGFREPTGHAGTGDYHVTLYTGDRPGAGTTADVFIQMYGTNGIGREHWLRIPLEKLNNKTVDANYILPFESIRFSRGSCVQLRLEPCQHLGEIFKIRLGHNNKGRSPSWFLEKVIIDDLITNRVFQFNCNRWLARDQEDGKINRELVCAQHDELGISGRKLSKMKCEIRISTADAADTATTARAYIKVHGPENKNNQAGYKAQSSPRIWLNNGDFRRGRTEVFEVDIPVLNCLSPFTSLDIGHDNSGSSPSWFVEKITIFCYSTGVLQVFPCDKWMNSSTGDRKIERSLSEDKRQRVVHSKKTEWVISVHTSDMKLAGTNASVFCQLYGSNGNTDPIPLKKDHLAVAGKSINIFEQNSLDEFKAFLPEIGVPSKIRVWHDNKGAAPGWHLNQIIAKNILEGKEYLFKCVRWLSLDEDDHSIIREIPATGPDIKEPLCLLKYKVTVYTGNKPNAGTDANVFICMYGKNGDSGDRVLTHSSKHKNKFERGKIDEFLIEVVDLGEINKLKIGHDGTKPGDGWYLDKIVIENVSQIDKQFVFEVFKWFDISQDDGQLVREVGGNTVLQGTTYQISIQTGTARGSGTDANVFMIIFGLNGVTGSINLKNYSGAKNKFESGRIDTFQIDSIDVGDIKRVRLWHDDAGVGSSWFVEQVTILVPHTGHKYTFSVKKWLDKKHGTEIDLEPTEFQLLEDLTPYEITVHTSDKTNAGTDANVFVQIYGLGLHKKTNLVQLRNRDDNFQRASVDRFKIYDLDVGAISKLRIGHDNTGAGPGWHLGKVIIQKIQSKEPKVIPTSLSSALESDRTRSETKRPRTFLDGSSRSSSRESITLRRQIIEAPSMETIDEIENPFKGMVFSNPEAFISEEVESYWFFVNRWFSYDEDDGLVIRELLPVREDGKSLSNLNELTYTVSVKTGDRFGAGTDAHVFLTIFSATSDSGERRLAKSLTHNNKFERGHTDKFLIKALELGPLTKVKIRHDNTKGASPWYLDYIHITHTDNREGFNVSQAQHETLVKEYLFTCYKWLSTTDGDGLISRELVPADPITLAKWREGKDIRQEARLTEEDKLTSYTVKVYTGKVPGAGTDASVFIILYGTLEDTGMVPLKTSLKPDGSIRKDKFEAGKCDTFKIKALDIGPIKKIRIGHDNTGGGAAWFLDYVEVEAAKLGQTLLFNCNTWLGLGVGQGVLEMDLLPQENLTTMYKPKVTFEIVTYTGDITGASTSAGVFIQLYGSEGTASDLVRLNIGPEARNKFKRGKKDIFYVELEDLPEPLTKIRIGHDGNGIGAGWYLDKVEVRRMINADNHLTLTYEFNCKRWLAKDEDDGQIERELLPSRKYESKIENEGGKAGQVSIQEHSINQEISMKHYQIKVYTGDLEGSGTNANVFLTLQGNKGDSGERKLSDSLTYLDKFERKQTDIFIWEAADLGAIYKARIRHDNTGMSPSWFLEKIEVQEITGNIKSKNPTLVNSPVVFQCERWLAKTKSDKKCERTLYCEGYTGERSASGTLASVRGSSFNLQASQSDVLKNIGSLLSIKGGQSPRNIGGSKVNLSAVSNRSLANKDNLIFVSPTITVSVKVTTGSMSNAGTKGPVWLELVDGKDENSGKLLLQSLETGNEIPKATTKTYIFDSINMDTIKSITIGNEAIGSENTSLYIETVQVEFPTKGKKYLFKCNSWLSKTQSDGLTTRTFTATQDILKEFKPLKIETANVDGAGTDCDVFLKLYGTQGDSNEHKFDKNTDRFERNSKDELMIDMEDVGTIRKIRLRHSGLNDRRDWKPDTVEIIDFSRALRYLFTCDQWLSNRLGQHKRLYIDLPATLNNKQLLNYKSYLILVKTSNIQGAGTDANVYICLYGQFGDSGDLWLEKSETHSDPFERNHIDKFTIGQMVDLGELGKCRLWTDNKGLGAAWHCEYIEIQEIPSPDVNKEKAVFKIWKFICNQWLSSSKDDKQISRYLQISETKNVDNQGREIATERAIEIEAQLNALNIDSVKSTQPGDIIYDVQITTADQKNAGTLHTVWIILIGEKDHSRPFLMQSDLTTKNFSRGQTDYFKMPNPPIGKIKAAYIGLLMNKEASSAVDRKEWFCEKLQVYDPISKMFVKFNVNEKIHAFPDLQVRSGKKIIPYEQVEDASQTYLQKIKDLKKCKYRVMVLTGDKSGAGTNANVFITMFSGSQSGLDSGKMQLRKKNTNLFEKNQVDTFELECVELGEIDKIRIEHDNSGLFADWYLAQVEVTNIETNKKWSFPCNQWLSKTKGDAQVWKEISAF